MDIVLPRGNLSLSIELLEVDLLTRLIPKVNVSCQEGEFEFPISQCMLHEEV